MLTDILLVLLALVLALAGRYRWRTTKLPLPPGPKGYPIVGNLFDMPFKEQWVRYCDWCKQYSKWLSYLVEPSINTRAQTQTLYIFACSVHE